MNFEKLNYSVTNEGVAVVEMNNPDKLNPIDKPMANELEMVFHQAEEDRNVKVVVFKGAGRAFSGGGDVAYFNDMVKAGLDLELISRQMIQMGHLVDFIKKMPKLVITEVQGAAAGGGATLALTGDFMFCADNVKFYQAFVNISLVPDIGGTYLLSKMIGPNKTMDVITTGRVVRADEMKQLGLAYEIVPKEKLDDRVMEFANNLAKGPLVAYGRGKREVYESNYRGLINYIENVEFPMQMEAFKTADFAEGVAAFCEKRKADFKGI